MNVSSEALVRSTYLGSSDIAAVLGVSRWKTPVQVYLNKTAPGWADGDVDPERERRFLRGKLMEPVVRQMAEQEFGLSIAAIGQRYADPEHDFLRAEIDFEIDEHGLDINCEVKTVHPFAPAEWGDEGTDEIPTEYAAQVQFGMMVTGRPRCYVFALFGSDNLTRYVVERDETTIAGMRAKAVSFWRDRVLAGVPPEPITYEDAVVLMSRMKRGVRVPASDIAAALVRRIDELRGFAKDIEAEQEAAKTNLAAWIVKQCQESGTPENENVVLTDYAGREFATWNLRRGTFLDQNRLAAEKPDIRLAYTKEHHYRVLILKGAK